MSVRAIYFLYISLTAQISTLKDRMRIICQRWVSHARNMRVIMIVHWDDTQAAEHVRGGRREISVSSQMILLERYIVQSRSECGVRRVLADARSWWIRKGKGSFCARASRWIRDYRHEALIDLLHRVCVFSYSRFRVCWAGTSDCMISIKEGHLDVWASAFSASVYMTITGSMSLSSIWRWRAVACVRLFQRRWVYVIDSSRAQGRTWRYV